MVIYRHIVSKNIKMRSAVRLATRRVSSRLQQRVACTPVSSSIKNVSANLARASYMTSPYKTTGTELKSNRSQTNEGSRRYFTNNASVGSRQSEKSMVDYLREWTELPLGLAGSKYIGVMYNLTFDDSILVKSELDTTGKFGLKPFSENYKNELRTVWISHTENVISNFRAIRTARKRYLDGVYHIIYDPNEKCIVAWCTADNMMITENTDQDKGITTDKFFDRDGLQIGVEKKYSYDKLIKSTAYNKGVKHGEEITYYSDQQIKEIRRNNAGSWNFECVRYRENGKPKIIIVHQPSYKTFLHIMFDENGNADYKYEIAEKQYRILMVSEFMKR